MDHIKLAKERERLCLTNPGPCDTCLMYDLMVDCRDVNTTPCESCRLACMYEPEKATEIISKWSAENPEPRYPTWREWFLTFLPEVPIALLVRFRLNGPCDIHLHEGVVEVTCCGRESSEYKLNVPIPAVVAEMLKVSMIAPEKGAAT